MKISTVHKVKKTCPYCGTLNHLRIAGGSEQSEVYHGEYKYSGKCIECFKKIIWEEKEQ